MYPDIKNNAIPKVATGLGGGIGRSGSVCGALTGAVLAVGLKYEASEINQEAKALAYTKASTLFRKFEGQHGSVNCRTLIKFDLSTPQGLAKAKEEKAFELVCTKLIKNIVVATSLISTTRRGRATVFNTANLYFSWSRS